MNNIYWQAHWYDQTAYDQEQYSQTIIEENKNNSNDSNDHNDSTNNQTDSEEVFVPYKESWFIRFIKWLKRIFDFIF